MFFRFACAIILIVVVSLLGIALEKRILSLKRQISLQHYRTEQLLERRARLRMRAEQLGAPTRLIDAVAVGEVELELSRREPAESRDRLE